MTTGHALGVSAITISKKVIYFSTAPLNPSCSFHLLQPLLRTTTLVLQHQLGLPSCPSYITNSLWHRHSFIHLIAFSLPKMKSVLSHVLLALAATTSVSAAPWYHENSFDLVERAAATSAPSLESVPAEQISPPTVVSESKKVATTDPQALAKGYGTLCVSFPAIKHSTRSLKCALLALEEC